MLPLKTNFCVGLITASLSLSTFGQDGGDGASDELDDGPLDLSQFPGMLIDDVIVPIPSEIFSIMGKLGEESFDSEIVDRKPMVSRERSRLALGFGIAVADGFIAVQAQDEEGIEQAGRSVLRLSEALGLKSRVLQHTQKIVNRAGREDWSGVREELDRTQQTVRDTMEEMRDGDLANCVSIGGWIRGTEAMTSLISNAYKPSRAELLNQPELATHFSQLIGQMDGKVREVDEVRAADACLKQIVEIMGAGDGVLDKEAVEEIHDACENFVRSIFASAPEEQGRKP